MSLKDISECCNNLCSTKINERKKSAGLLTDLIGNNHIVSLINSSDTFTWNTVVESVHNYLIKESDKLWETELKKRTNNAAPMKVAGGDVLIRVVQVANRGKARIKASRLISLILSWYKSPNLKRYYSSAYIYVLKDFLSMQEYHGKISRDEWLDLLNLLKSLQGKSIPELDKYKYLQCLLLLIQWGPENGLSSLALRQEFCFIIKLCKQFDSTCTRYVQECLLKILLAFCRHTAKDCRLACCMLGESVMENVLRFYESTTCDNIVNLLLFEFLLLQINIHHPNGVPENSSISCAHSWPTWNKQICSIFTILRSEINNNLNIKYKKSTLFVNYKNFKTVHEIVINAFIESFKQLYGNTNTNFNASHADINSESQPLVKRRRVEVSVTSLIQIIQDTRDWPWINILHILLRKYPDIIREDDFLFLLQTLSSLQVESKDSDMQHHIYECLSVMIDVQKNLDFIDVTTVSSLWLIVWDSTVRATGLNQDNEQTNKLLQKLILNEKSLLMAPLFRTYFSGVNSVNEYSIKTLDIACYCYGLPKEGNEKNARETLMRWILCFESDKSFNVHTLCHPSTTKVLTSLILKQWPLYYNKSDISGNFSFKSANASIEDLYFKTNFEIMLDYNDKCIIKNEEINKTYSQNTEALEIFNEILNNMVEYVLTNIVSEMEKLKHLTSISILLINITSHMVEYNILDEVESCTLVGLVKNLFEEISKVFCDITINIEESNFGRIVEVINLFKRLFITDINQSVIELVIKLFPVPLLQKLFGLLRSEDVQTRVDVKQGQELKKLCLEVLCDYCCCHGQKLSIYQQFALETLAKQQLNEVYADEYDEKIIFLTSLRKYKPGSLNKEIILVILEIIKIVCISQYTFNSAMLNVLDVLYDLYPHVHVIESSEIKEMSVKLLSPIYERYRNYSPNVAVLLLKCLRRLIQVDPQMTWARWEESGDIAKVVPSFLCNEFQEIRFATIRTLSALFSIPCNDKMIYLHQKEIFETVVSVLNKIFEVEIISLDGSSAEEVEALSRERDKDETATRTATVIHVLSAIMVSSNIWRQRSFFTLLQICEQKNILNSELFKKALNLLAKTLHTSNTVTLFELHLEYLIENWYRWKSNLSSFPYQLLEIDSLMTFYCKYKTVIVPFLVQFCSIEELEEICVYLKQPVLNVVEESYPKIMATCLPAFEEIGITNIVNKEDKKKAYKNLVQVLGIEKLSVLLQDKIDEVLLNLVDSVFDTEHLKDLFEVNQVFFESHSSHFTVSDLEKIVAYIQKKTTQGEALLQHHISCYPSKIQNILLQLKANIYKATTIEAKLQKFHHFAIVINMMLPSIKIVNPMQEFLIRDICFTLLNLLSENFHSHTILNILAMKYFKAVLKIVLPECSRILKNHLLVIVSILTPIAKCNSEIATESLCLLKFLLLDNSTCLSSAIEALDPFPSEDKFKPLQEVYEKFKSKDASLEYQINHFLNAGRLIMGNIGCRLEGLKNLKIALSSNKEELKILFSNLYEIRGFSEDCQKSILHQLICMLVKSTYLNDQDIALEATKCLGEIGAADLTTFVLQTETIQDGLKCGNQLELLTGIILSLLTQYIIDPDFNVVETSSSALYHVMNSKEAKIVVDSKKDYGLGTIDKSYLTPFVAMTKIRSNLNINVEINSFEKEIDSEELWCTNNSHDVWITNLVCSLLKHFDEKCYLNHLIPVCKAKVSFCEKIFPILIYVLLHTNKNVIAIICRNMKNFLTKHWNLRRIHSGQESKEICINKASAQCFLNVINFARLQDNLSLKKKVAELKLDYLKVAFMAQFCSAHFTSLLYAELWCEERISEIQYSQKETSRVSKLDLLAQTQENISLEILQNILKEAYKAIGDFDALQGCGLSHLLDIQSRIEHYKQQDRWGQVVQFYEVEVAHGKSKAFGELMHSLKKSCLYQLPALCNSDSEIDYECLWRLSKWSTNQTQKQHTFDVQRENNFEKLRYMALKSLFENNQCVFPSFIKDARYSIIDNLKHASLESSKNLYPYLMQLQSLQEIEDMAAIKTTNGLQVLFNKWKLQDCINPNDFQYVEPIRAQRITILNNCFNSSEKFLKEALVKLNLEVSSLARTEGYLNVANRVMACVSQIDVMSSELKAEIMYEQAQLCWANNDKTTGKYLLKHLLSLDGNSPSLHCLALKLYGTWMIETHSENAQTIIMNYFLNALKINCEMEKTAKTEEMKSETCNVLAQFADKKYQQIVSYIESSVFEQKVKNMERSKLAAQELSKAEKTQDVRRALAIHLKHNAIDNNEIMNTYQEKDTYLLLSVKYYAINLQSSDVQNENIFRIISLWLDNRNNIQLNELLQNQLPEIPSYKFITILPQLIPHLTNNDDDNFGKEIGAIIERCAIEHPHHTLPIILALANSNKDRLYASSDTNTSSNENRVRGANTLLDKLKKKSKFLNLIGKMENLADALIELAYTKDSEPSKSDNSRTIPYFCKIRKIKNYDDVLLPTCTLPINVDGNYSEIIGISHFEDKYYNVGGINAPKRITCRGTDGLIRTQLVKGQDDLRQDAVMQQVFTIMNRLLANNKQTNRLLIRTYKIVPLSMRSGILEWVVNTTPIGDYLVGDNGAHMKYGRIKDYNPSKCRALFKTAGDKKTLEEKLEIYNTICDNFKPVFHKFFETSFPQATVWYERRQAFMHSVATSSMCGYILGLGDRHVQNILIDLNTAEVIHIDFGIAFEQGRVLPTPETVPFRLTRDIEDGMGVSGVDGVFRRSCEKTMEVLRQNGQTIITILEVLLYDPLYAWTVSAAEAYSRQQDDDDVSMSFSDSENININVTAKRALLRLRNKLHGTEEGISSIESQVEKLIQQARDPANLCRLFHGWQPYL